MEASPKRSVGAPDLDLRDGFAILRRHAPAILGATVLAAAITLGVAFLLPKWYRATAVILPPEESDLLSNMSLAQRALTKFPAFGVLDDYFTPADTYKAILLSRTVEDAVIQHFDLQRVYHLPSLEKTERVLKGLLKVKLNPDGTIQVSVEDRDPRRAAAMTNDFLTELDRFNVEKRNTQAHRTRVFLERRLAETDSLLRDSEGKLRAYQERHRAVAPTNAETGEVRSAADLMARKLMLEVRLGMLKTYLSPESDQVRQAQLELDQLGTQIAGLPALESEFARLVRDTKVHEQLMLLLTSELEQARIRETMDTPTVEVLDPAVPPERQSRPRRLTLAAAAGLLAFAAASITYVLRERVALTA